MKVFIKKLSRNAKLPHKSTYGAAAYDVYVPNDITIKHGRQIIPLDFAIELPYGYEAKIESRSGFSAKGMEGIILNQSDSKRFDCDVLVGKIDSDFRGNVGVIINNRDCEFIIAKHTRIAQLTIYKVEDAEWDEVDELSETDRADGGFGHTGNK